MDLPKCGRCAFRGRRPENVCEVSKKNLIQPTISINGVVYTAKHEHMRRSVFAGGDNIDKLVS